MNAIDVLRQDYDAKLQNDLEYIDLDLAVGELRVWFRPCTSLFQQRKMLAMDSLKEKPEALVEAMIAKALTEDGEKMFKPAEKVDLMRRVDGQVLVDAVNRMYAEEVDFEEARKNSPAMPGSVSSLP